MFIDHSIYFHISLITKFGKYLSLQKLSGSFTQSAEPWPYIEAKSSKIVQKTSIIKIQLLTTDQPQFIYKAVFEKLLIFQVKWGQFKYRNI